MERKSTRIGSYGESRGAKIEAKIIIVKMIKPKTAKRLFKNLLTILLLFFVEKVFSSSRFLI